jgi:hypothetical protein
MKTNPDFSWIGFLAFWAAAGWSALISFFFALAFRR